MKLDLGAGNVSPEGFTPLGHNHGSEIFPLPYPDESIDELYCSHVLEHFTRTKLTTVFNEWVRVLKKGGRMRVAVPDFEKIAVSFVQGDRDRHEDYLMGAQTDDDDLHKSIFDRARLRMLFANAGMVLIRPWTSEIGDSASLPVSLNLEGYKPFVPEIKVSGAMSVPRLGFMDNFFAAMESVLACKIKFRKHGGAFWGQSMTNVFEKILEEDSADAILTMDYDSIFLPKHLAHLMQLMMLHPEIDALAPIQSSRHLDGALFTVPGPDGKNVGGVDRARFDADVIEVNSAHFGLTLIRTDKLRKLPKPWFHAIPSPNNDWHDGHVDDDIAFWHKWREHGNTLYIANRVVIGHAELMARWPDINLQVFYQSMTDFQLKGVPDEVWK